MTRHLTGWFPAVGSGTRSTNENTAITTAVDRQLAPPSIRLPRRRRPQRDLADVVHVTSNILARPDDDACAFDAEILAAEAGNALRRHGYKAIALRPPVVIDGVTLDVSALVLPVLDTDACAVDTRIQLVVDGDNSVLLAAEHFNLLTWTTAGLLRRPRWRRHGRSSVDCQPDCQPFLTERAGF